MATQEARIQRIENALEEGDERFSKIEEQMKEIVTQQKEQSHQMARISETLTVLNTIVSLIRGSYLIGKVVAWIGGITGFIVTLISLLNYMK